VVSAAIVAAIFGFALPRFASYRSAWASMGAMTGQQALLVAAAAVGSMVFSWLVICSVLPSVRLREAAVVNLGSSAVANTLPAGGALAMGVSWAMLSGWGVSTADYVLYTLVSGIWNVFARLALPVVALGIMVTVSRPGAGLIAAAATGLALLCATAVGLGLVLRSESLALEVGGALWRAFAVGCRLVRRQPPGVPGWLPGFHSRATALLAARGWRITVVMAAGNLALWLVLLACLRGTGLSQAQVPWQTSLAAFAFVRLLTALPVTPGGLGITELGLIGTLTAASADHRATAQVTAAVLLYRAVTYLPPIPLGALACLVWRHAPALIHASPHHTEANPETVSLN
jgi:uncharacterized membrane protein YbhN (UPF0104 family)